MTFTHAITRRPAASYPQGISTSNLGKPTLTLALQQHAGYVRALQDAGLQVAVLPATEDYPDSVFVEDSSIVTPDFAVVSRPGADSKLGEIEDMQPILAQLFESLYRIIEPGTLDGGDICQVDKHFFIGVSERTNQQGAQQLSEILGKYGFSSELIDIHALPGILHFKSAVNYLGDNTLLVDARMADHPALDHYQKLVVPLEEAYAANCLRVNGVVLVPDGFPVTLELVQSAGFSVVVLAVSEYQKMDGGLSCLSLRW